MESIETGTWNLAPYTIEHLNPDSDDRKNANIGNLVLLEQRINEKNGNKSFIEKIDSYMDSGFKTARNVYKRYHENPDGFLINVRADKMAEKIYNQIREKENALLALLEKK